MFTFNDTDEFRVALPCYTRNLPARTFAEWKIPVGNGIALKDIQIIIGRTLQIALLLVAAALIGCKESGNNATPADATPADITVPSDLPPAPVAWGIAHKIGHAPLMGAIYEPPPVKAATLDDGSVLVLSQDWSYRGKGLLGENVYDRVLTAIRVAPDGTYIDTFEVARSGTSSISIHSSTVAVDETGSAFIAWMQQVHLPGNSVDCYQLHVRRYNRDAGLGPDIVFHNDNRCLDTFNGWPTAKTVLSYQLGVFPDSKAVIAWLEDTAYGEMLNEPQTKIFVATYSDSQGWSEEQVVTIPKEIGNYTRPHVQLGLSRNNKALIAWNQQEGDRLRIYSSIRREDGTWASPDTIVDIPNNGDSLVSPRLAMDNNGNAMAVWTFVSRDATICRIQYNRFDANDGWLGVDTISDCGGIANWLEIASDLAFVMNSEGSGIVAWRYGYYVFAAWFNIDGWQGAQALSAQEEYGASKYPHLIMDENGSAAAIWNQITWDGSEHSVVRGSLFTPGSGWSAGVTLSEKSEVGLPIQTSGVNAGKATAVWLQGDITGGGASTWIMQFPLAK